MNHNNLKIIFRCWPPSNSSWSSIIFTVSISSWLLEMLWLKNLICSHFEDSFPLSCLQVMDTQFIISFLIYSLYNGNFKTSSFRIFEQFVHKVQQQNIITDMLEKNYIGICFLNLDDMGTVFFFLIHFNISTGWSFSDINLTTFKRQREFHFAVTNKLSGIQ